MQTDLKLIMESSQYKFCHLKLDYYCLNIHILVTNLTQEHRSKLCFNRKDNKLKQNP